MKRDIIRIDETKCTGCSECIPNCPEGALQVIDGKARLVSDLSCDGLGACIGHCPEDAISIEQREAEPYDERKVMEKIVGAGPNVIRAHLDHLKDHGQSMYLAQALDFLKQAGIPAPAPGRQAPRAGAAARPVAQAAVGPEAEAHGGTSHACPGSKTMDFRGAAEGRGLGAPAAPSPSRLRQWPVQLHLLNPRAPYFQDADLLVASDCVPFSYAGFHERFLMGRALVIFCPKLDDSDEIYVEKLAEIIKHNSIKSITVLHMEVPCCFGTTHVVQEALKRSGKRIAVKDETVSIRGDIV